MGKGWIATGLLAAATVATPAGAQAFNGAGKIMHGDYAAAERDLRASRAANPEDVDLLLNLATLYAQTGRPMQARALYREVAALPDEPLTVVNGATASSRTLAAAGLARLPESVAAR